MEIIYQITVGILGVFIYNLIAFRKYLRTDKIKEKLFWESYWIESRFLWLWSIVLMSVVSVTINVLPDSAEILKQATGLDVANNLMAFLSMGLGVSASLDSNK